MTFKEKVGQLLTEALQEKESIFLIDFEVLNSNKIMITLDGDQGVTLQDCIDVSRAIEHNLDREEYDFELEVASAGLSTPLKFVRQYKKNIGRWLIVQTASQTIEALLTEANDEHIVLEWNAREPKKTGKGKETVKKTEKIPYVDIKQAVVTVKF